MVRLTGGHVRRSVETGAGKSTLLLSHLSDRHTVFAVDGGDSVKVTLASDLLNRDHIEFVDGPTQRTLLDYPFAEPLDFVLIDGPHGYPFPELEYWVFYRHIRTGGLMVVDDIHIPTIHSMFQFLREEPMFELVEVVGTTAFFRRTVAPTFDPYCDGWYLQKFNTSRFPIDIDSYMAGPPASASLYRDRLLPLIEGWKASGARVAIFGIGEHTDQLMRVFRSSSNCGSLRFLIRVPRNRRRPIAASTVRAPAWVEGNCDVVLCSSFGHELAQMALLDRMNVKVVPSHVSSTVGRI